MNLKQENNIPSLTLQYNNKKLKMLKTKDYLEWTFKSFDGDNTFIITMEDYDIYEIFYKLYSDIKQGNIFDEEDINTLFNSPYNSNLLDINSEVKTTLEYINLFHNDKIRYKSDSNLNKEQVTITKGEDYFKLVFKSTKNTTSKKIVFGYPTTKDFKCTKPFIRLFDNLSNIDLTYHQINFYELSKTAI